MAFHLPFVIGNFLHRVKSKPVPVMPASCTVISLHYHVPASHDDSASRHGMTGDRPTMQTDTPTPRQGSGNRASFINAEAVKQMANRLQTAALTLQMLPRSSAGCPAGARSGWPEMMRHSRFAIEQTRRATPPPTLISPASSFISRPSA